MIYIGIDFSLNSPGICIFKDNEYTFLSFFNYGDRDWSDKSKNLKAFKWHRKLETAGAIKAIPYNRKIESKEFLEKQREKLVDSDILSRRIESYLHDLIKEDQRENVRIGLEGFSYGSKGNSFIDIIQYNTFLRKRLLDYYGSDKIYIFPPSKVKKLTGKGNANKNLMVESFQENILSDPILAKNKFFNLISKESFQSKIPKPIDDLIDSYFIVQTLIKEDQKRS